MPTFIHPSLLWGLPIIALPVLIHLINMMRRRRVQWAAMEFLIASQKKHRTWILLKQLFLLVLRMAAIAAIVLLVARPMFRHQWSSLLGGIKMHHIILLDDSFSMSDHWNDTTAFDEAKRVIERIGAEAARSGQAQVFTLLPFSRARRNRSVQNELINIRVGNDFASKLAETLKKLDVSQTDAGPADALLALDQLLGDPEGERRILYVISDFRATQWSEPDELKKSLQRYQTAANDKIRLINCIDRVRANLAIESLKPEPCIRAAGVPWFMEAAVTNFSDTPAKDVSVTLSEDGHARPSVIFPEILPGRTVKERFQVNFQSQGWHEIAARLESDAVDADNYRFYTINLPDDVPVLLIDGDSQARDAQFLGWAMSPGGSVRTGLRPQIETQRFPSLKPLDGFGTIVLSNIDRLDNSAVKSLEQYAASGGGVAFFMGEICSAKYFNDELYRDGKGLFPLPLKGPAELPMDRLETAPDVQVDKHFLFRIFAELRNTFLPTIMVHRYFSVAEYWKPSSDSAVRVIARLRNGAPLVVERPFGKGRVVAFLTTAAPIWNNWAKNPSFVVVLQDLQAYLSHQAVDDSPRMVGEPLELTFDPAKYQPQVRFVVPREPDSPLAATDAAPNAEGKLFAALSETDKSGVYEAQLTRRDNSTENRRYAFNVNPAEGNLAAFDKSRLAERLKGLKYEYEQASTFQSAADETAGNDPSEIILYSLVLLLAVEQILAWSASYHPNASRALFAGRCAMIHGSLPILAEGVSRTTFQWGRIQANSDWILPIGVCITLMLFVRYMYRRDAAELPPIVSWQLTALRTAAFLGLLILYLQPHWQLEREVVRNSKALLLVDTSLSMGINDSESTKTPADKQPAAASRAHQVAAMLEETDFINRLRKINDVSIYQFNDDLKVDASVSLNEFTEPAADENEKPMDWEKILAPSGTETRLGQALRDLIQKERSLPLGSIIVFSDGGQNAGISPQAAIELAREVKVPVFTVGLGSDIQPKNVRVSDLIVPARAYPGDRYTITGYLQARHMAGEEVTVQVLSRPSGFTAETGAGQLLETKKITLAGDGEIVPLKFELTPEAVGRRTICFRVQSAPGDANPNDNSREAEIEIVDRKNHVLLFAGGPMRDYQFLRTLLYRDRSTTLDVFVQTGQAGMSQEGKILTEFPSTREAMYDYDCVVAFDPDWQALSAGQVELLESWIADQGGGLIAIAGPIYAGASINSWMLNRAMAPIRNLYPVEFPRRLSSAEVGSYSSPDAWPLEFTREGLEADFLSLNESASGGRRAWAEFPGVYSYCPVRKAKAGATVYSRFSDPRAAQGAEQPIYMAGQFYGSGRVFYIGSGEMWRLRAIDESYFEQFYTKLIRHVTQGRLLRGSSHGVLLTGQDRYLLGNSVEVRAQLMNSRLEPLAAPGVEMQVFAPDGTMQNLVLRPDPSRQGTYQGQFPATEEGAYRLDLIVPETDNERLIRRIQVRMPELERENPQRNDALLGLIAKQTGGKYYIGLDAMFRDKPTLAEQLPDRTSTIVQTDVPDPKWEQTWLRWMMITLCALLCTEWLIRRLAKLA